QYSGGLLNFGHFIFSQADDTPVLSKVNGRKLKLDELIASHIRLVLEETQGKISGAGGAAELLGINPNTLRCRMDKLGIKYGKKKQVGHITNSQS
ncbi:MAG: sigma-54-dependent Fis family transcriptional regulator, partial [Desulfobacterium sp.]|nr:sigma-54-dependent Fis family transcriptional regulator [Desulfobacterium sp.]MBU4037771.1 sigma-54-dependent Fis family transcriptional regulator [Pseudomonadota bacterium]